MMRAGAILLALLAFCASADIAIGNKTGSKVYLGATELDAVYLGHTLMFSRAALPQITAFTATPSSRPTGQTGNTVLAWTQTGANSLRLTNSAGTVIPTPDSTATEDVSNTGVSFNTSDPNVITTSTTQTWRFPADWFTSGTALDIRQIRIYRTNGYGLELVPFAAYTRTLGAGRLDLRAQGAGGTFDETYTLRNSGDPLNGFQAQPRTGNFSTFFTRAQTESFTLTFRYVETIRSTGVSVVSPASDERWTLTATNTEGSTAQTAAFTRTVPVAISNVQVVNEGQTPQAAGSVIQSFRITMSVTGKPFPTLSISPSTHGARSSALNRSVRNQSGNTRNAVVELRAVVTPTRESITYTIRADNGLTNATATATVNW